MYLSIKNNDKTGVLTELLTVIHERVLIFIRIILISVPAITAFCGILITQLTIGYSEYFGKQLIGSAGRYLLEGVSYQFWRDELLKELEKEAFFSDFQAFPVLQRDEATYYSRNLNQISSHSWRQMQRDPNNPKRSITFVRINFLSGNHLKHKFIYLTKSPLFGGEHRCEPGTENKVFYANQLALNYFDWEHQNSDVLYIRRMEEEPVYKLVNHECRILSGLVNAVPEIFIVWDEASFETLDPGTEITIEFIPDKENGGFRQIVDFFEDYKGKINRKMITHGWSPEEEERLKKLHQSLVAMNGPFDILKTGKAPRNLNDKERARDLEVARKLMELTEGFVRNIRGMTFLFSSLVLLLCILILLKSKEKTLRSVTSVGVSGFDVSLAFLRLGFKYGLLSLVLLTVLIISALVVAYNWLHLDITMIRYELIPAYYLLIFLGSPLVYLAGYLIAHNWHQVQFGWNRMGRLQLKTEN